MTTETPDTVEQIDAHLDRLPGGAEARQALADRVRGPAAKIDAEETLRTAHTALSGQLGLLIERKEDVLAEIKEARSQLEVLGRAVAVFDRWHAQDREATPEEE